MIGKITKMIGRLFHYDEFGTWEPPIHPERGNPMTAKHLLDQIVRGLDGVTPGSWVVKETTLHGIGYGGHWLEVADESQDICISGSGGARSYTQRVVDTQLHDDNEANLRHFARCSPDAIREIAAYVREIEAERDSARNDEWLAAITAVQYMEANWHQDCRSEVERNALVSVAEDFISALKHAGPTEYLDMKWKDAQAAMAAEERASAAESRVRDLEDRLAKAAEALEPFNTDWATEDGWTDYACQNDRVVDWFGPSDFRRAAEVFSQIRSEK